MHTRVSGQFKRLGSKPLRNEIPISTLLSAAATRFIETDLTIPMAERQGKTTKEMGMKSTEEVGLPPVSGSEPSVDVPGK